MEKTIEELKILIRDLVLEIGDLRERVTLLEQQLQSGLSDLSREEEPSSDLNQMDVLQLQGEGYDNLGKLYRDGYHVCPTAFGKRRKGDCLFCIAFMEKE